MTKRRLCRARLNEGPSATLSLDSFASESYSISPDSSGDLWAWSESQYTIELQDQSNPMANSASIISAYKDNAVIILPPCLFRISSCDLPPANNVTIKGHESGTIVVICANCAGFNLVKGHSNVILSDFAITREVNSGYGMISKYGNTGHLKNIKIVNVEFSAPDSAWNAITLHPWEGDAFDNIVISRCKFSDIGRMGIEVWSSAAPNSYQVDNVKIEECEFSGIGLVTEPLCISYVPSATGSAQILKCKFIANKTNCVGIEATSRTTIEDCVFESTQNFTVEPFTVSGSTWGDCIAYRCVEPSRETYGFKTSSIYGGCGSGFSFIDCDLGGLRLRSSFGNKLIRGSLFAVTIENGQSSISIDDSVVGSSSRPQAIVVKPDSVGSTVSGADVRCVSAKLATLEAVVSVDRVWYQGAPQ